jgi:hypothetical protein
MDELLPRNRFVTEHVVFIVLLIPTIIVLAAALLSLADLEPAVAVQASVPTTAACEPCQTQEEDEQQP